MEQQPRPDYNAPEYDQYWAEDFQSSYKFTYETALTGLREMNSIDADDTVPGGYTLSAQELFLEAKQTLRQVVEVAKEWGFNLMCGEHCGIIAAADQFLSEYKGFRDYNAY